MADSQCAWPMKVVIGRKVKGECWSEKAEGYVSCSANPKSSA